MDDDPQIGYLMPEAGMVLLGVDTPGMAATFHLLTAAVRRLGALEDGA